MTEPKAVPAGEVSKFRFTYTPSTALPKGTVLKFDVASKGRQIDWEAPSTNLKAKQNVIYVEMPSGSKGAFEASEEAQGLSPEYFYTLPEDVAAEEPFSIIIDENRAQCHIQRRRPFFLSIDTKGKGDFKDPESFFVDIKGRELHTIRAVVPSMVGRNVRFDVLLRFEDRYGNLTGLAPEGTLIELSYEQLRENLSWKLFVPETGFINLPNLYFNEDGIYRLKLYNAYTKETFLSSPIICVPDASQAIYWGQFHGEAVRYDAEEHIESLLRHMRDDVALQFYSTSNFESEDEMPSDLWKKVTSTVADFNEDDRFISFSGHQWFGDDPSEGLRQIVFLKDNKPLLRKKETKSNALKKIYKGHTPKDLISIPTFTMGKDIDCDFSDHNPEFEPVVEIYNAWGSSECTEKEGNPRPISSKSKDGVKETQEGSIRRALNNNHRFGFVAGGYDDRGVFHGLHGTDQVQYSAGITGILASAHTRDGLISALHRRSCYATTGARMVMGLSIAGEPMGSMISTGKKPGLAYVRYLTGYCVGTEDLEVVEIIRNGEVFHSFQPDGFSFTLEFDDTDPLADICLKGEENPFTYYYLRAIQKDGHIAWSSPIWIDLSAEQAAKKGKKKK